MDQANHFSFLTLRCLQEACTRLTQQADALAHVLDGGALKIGFTNRVLQDASWIEIAHDSEL